jgi:hypothetical protein
MYTNQCEGILFNSCVPVFEKAIINITGKGINITKAGLGGKVVKSSKKPLEDNIRSNADQARVNIVTLKDILCCLVFSQPVLFTDFLKPIKIIVMQMTVNVIQANAGREK